MIKHHPAHDADLAGLVFGGSKKAVLQLATDGFDVELKGLDLGRLLVLRLRCGPGLRR